MCASIVPAHTAAELSSSPQQRGILRFFAFLPDCVVAPQLHALARRAANEHKGVDVATEDRGFASMDRVKQKEIASKGGKAAHQKGTAHEWTSDEARDAGRKGGLASHRRRREQKGSMTTQEMVGVESGSRSTGMADQVN